MSILPLGKQEMRLWWTWRLRAVLHVSSCRPERQADKLQVTQGDMLGRESGTGPRHRNNDLRIRILVWMIEQDRNEHFAFAASLKASYFLLSCKQIEAQTEGVWASALCFTVELGKRARAQCQNKNPRLSFQTTQILPTDWNKPGLWWNMLLCYTYLYLSLSFI